MPDYILVDDILDEMIDNITFIKLQTHLITKEN